MTMTSRQAAIRAKGKTSKRTGTVRVTRVADTQAKRNTLQKKDQVSPFTAGTMGLGVLSVPPKPVKR